MSGEHVHVEIPASVMLAAYAHAAETYPEECCGLMLGGPDGIGVDELRRCENRQNQMHALDPTTFKRDARTAYFFGPEDVKLLDKSLRKGAPRVTRVIYHSHCDVGAYFSASDRTAATIDGQPMYDVAYLVLDAVINGVMGGMVYAWNDKRHDFVPIASYGPQGQRVNVPTYI